jgi:hypothetical protein
VRDLESHDLATAAKLAEEDDPAILPAPPTYPHVWWWRRLLPERKGQACRVVARGGMNSVLVEFEDGQRVVTSRYAVRKGSAAS